MECLQHWFSADDSYEDHNDGHNEEDVNESAQCKCSYHSKKPENDENDCDGEYHKIVR